MTDALILCAGEQRRFPKGHPPKQLLRFDGETLLDRLIRQCLEIGAYPCVVSHLEALRRGKAEWECPLERATIIQTLKSTLPLWSARPVILLGDVFFSNAVFASIFACYQPVCFHLNGSEIFALTFSDRTTVLNALNELDQRQNYKIGKKVKTLIPHVQLWHLYRKLHGADIHKHVVFESEMTNRIDGEAFDVDSHKQYCDLTESFRRGLFVSVGRS